MAGNDVYIGRMLAALDSKMNQNMAKMDEQIQWLKYTADVCAQQVQEITVAISDDDFLALNNAEVVAAGSWSGGHKALSTMYPKQFKALMRGFLTIVGTASFGGEMTSGSCYVHVYKNGAIYKSTSIPKGSTLNFLMELEIVPNDIFKIELTASGSRSNYCSVDGRIAANSLVFKGRLVNIVEDKGFVVSSV